MFDINYEMICFVIITVSIYKLSSDMNKINKLGKPLLENEKRIDRKPLFGIVYFGAAVFLWILPILLSDLLVGLALLILAIVLIGLLWLRSRRMPELYDGNIVLPLRIISWNKVVGYEVVKSNINNIHKLIIHIDYKNYLTGKNGREKQYRNVSTEEICSVEKIFSLKDVKVIS